MCSIIHDYTDIARFLIENGADVMAIDRHGFTPLYHASRNGYASIIPLLLEKKADASAKGSCGGTLLDDACYWNHLDVVKLLVDHNSKLDEQNRQDLKKPLSATPTY